MSAPIRKLGRIFAIAFAALLALLSVACPLIAQTTVGTGSIVGNVSDPSGAVVSGALGVGTGVYSLGAPRQVELGLRLTF